MSQEQALCECGHPKDCHHDGTGIWGLGCNQPLAMEMKCPCKLYFTRPAAANDTDLDANTTL